MTDRFVRQADLVPQEGLAEEHVTVIGVGAIGRQAALQLASIGVRRLTLIDFDRVDETNITTQSFRCREIGMPKVEATRQAVLEIDPAIEVIAIDDRFRAKHLTGEAVFVCVDTISARTAIWRQIGHKVRFWCDARMLGEVLRILTVTNVQGRENYQASLFRQSQAQTGRCTSRSTIFGAAISAGLMLHQFTRWLRSIPCEQDTLMNLLGMEVAVTERPRLQNYR